MPAPAYDRTVGVDPLDPVPAPAWGDDSGDDRGAAPTVGGLGAPADPGGGSGPDPRPTAARRVSVSGWSPTWSTAGGPSAWPPGLPSSAAGSASPPPAAQRAGRRRGIWGTLLAGAAAVLHYGGLLLKLGAFKGTLITMVISVVFYSIFFGPTFAIAFVLLILVHEMGHYVVARRMGEDVSAPMFIPGLGALISMRSQPRTVAREAMVAMAGPLVGTVASLALLGLALALRSEFVAALAYIGCLLNLFNLIPASPLDGGRVTAAVSKWANLVGLAILVGYAVFAFTVARAASPILLIIVVVAAYSTLGRFRQARRQPEYLSVPTRTRWLVGSAYLALVLAAALGLAVSHASLTHLVTAVG